jgi:hypothetical protein
MRAKLENLHRNFLGPPTERSLLGSFSVHEDTLEKIWARYSGCFRDFQYFGMFINYASDYPKNDDIFASRWKCHKSTFKPYLKDSLNNFYCNSDEIHWTDWESQGFDEEGMLQDVIGSLDTVHGKINDFPKNHINNKKYFSVAYDTPCQKWNCVVANRGKIIYFSDWGMAGSTHDGTSYCNEINSSIGCSLPTKLNEIGKFLIADRLYEGFPRLLTPYKGNYFTDDQKNWNFTVSSRRALVENAFSRIKGFSLMKNIFRGLLSEHRQWGNCIANIVNVDLEIRPIRAHMNT